MMPASWLPWVLAGLLWAAPALADDGALEKAAGLADTPIDSRDMAVIAMMDVLENMDVAESIDILEDMDVLMEGNQNEIQD